MANRNNLSRALQFFFGRVTKAGYQSSKPGIEAHPLYVYEITPATADADGVCASQSITAAGLINGALASGGVATFDVPRNVVAAWTTTAVMTVTGTDVYGVTMSEASGSGTSMTGKKAFKTITAVAVSTAVTSATVGTGDVLGLPFRCDENGVLAARVAGAIDAGTFVEADTTSPATTTTGDTRGTFDPTASVNGSNKVSLLLKPAGYSTELLAFGVTQV